MKTYKDTVILPETPFEMQGRLKTREPEIQKRWQEMDIYRRIREARRGRPRYVLHDGPPYASGELHIGTGMNKILKDLAVKFETMRGRDAAYIPGWDCHGLPIERKVLDVLGDQVKTTPKAVIRHRCEEFARKYYTAGNKQFQALGIFGRWEKPYLTLDPAYEANVIDLFHELVLKGYVYRRRRPIHWCMTDETALAEAELEYQDRTSPSIHCRFLLDDAGAKAAAAAFGLPALPGPTGILIWTTTPWTLDGNMAVAVSRDAPYVLSRYRRAGREELSILAEARVSDVLARAGATGAETVATAKGERLLGVTYRHPWGERSAPVVAADYVSLDEGTGCVHTAPGHGAEDYETGTREGLDIRSPVGPGGTFTDEATPWLRGLHVFKANPLIIQRLRDDGSLLAEGEIVHSYPHCWRCKKPVIFRATAQWFVSVDRDDLRRRTLRAVDGVRWVPDWGKTRISAMLEQRPDWCISRQRAWGIPIPAFTCRGCGETVLDAPRVARVRDYFRQHGATAWFEARPRDLIGDLAACPKCGGELTQDEDIFDVWFESGSSWRSVCEAEPELGFPADVYLEGTDQHRGWFQLSLLPAMMARGRPPFRTVVTHGFVVDEQGEKMSKSLGNYISLEDGLKEFGGDILRLWFASCDTTDDVRVSRPLIKRHEEAYRKIRNTIRFLLGNLHDYDPPVHGQAAAHEILEVDRWALARTEALLERVTEGYEAFRTSQVYRLIHEFCVNDMSAFYLDIVRDRLYTWGKDDPRRRGAQVVLHRVASVLVRVLAPVLVHTAEEAFSYLPRDADLAGIPSVHLAPWPEPVAIWRDQALLVRWVEVQAMRDEVNKVIEGLRKAKEIGSSLEVDVSVRSEGPFKEILARYSTDDLAMFCIVSAFGVHDGASDGEVASEAHPGFFVRARRIAAAKCERCWRSVPSVGRTATHPTLCDRCVGVVG